MNKTIELKCPLSWKEQLEDEFHKPYMQALQQFLVQEQKALKTIYPEEADIFNALTLTPFKDVNVVILGQDPYHGPNQAHGLCFSVMPGVKLPPSLVNIYKELKQDLNIPPANHGCLSSWATQGVLLLNTVLTVEQGKPGSHQKKGWEQLTDEIILKLNKREDSIIFVLWGSHAQKKGKIIDAQRHYVLKSAHPSPLSAYQGFLGNQHFSTINTLLKQEHKAPIQWQLPQKPLEVF